MNSLTCIGTGMSIIKKTIGAVAVALTAGSAMAGSIVYETGSNGDPWGNQTNDAAMNAAFGASNWTKYTGFDLSAFTGASFVFLDGSESNSNDLQAFLATNQAAVEAFVSNGGHLFINDASNGGNSFDLGFGGVALTYPAFSSNATVTAAGVAAGLTDGGIPTSYTGNWFAHATLSGPITSLIDGDAGVVLGVEDFGLGLVLFGGQTTTNYHSTDGDLLLVNELTYAAEGAVSSVPEPSSLAFMAAGALALALRRRKA